MSAAPLVAVLLFAAGQCTLAQASELPDPEAAGLDADARLAALIARADLEKERQLPLRATFEQVESGPLRLEPEVSRGTLVLAEEQRARWDFSQPEERTLLVADGSVTTWIPAQQRAERRTLGQRGQRLLALVGGGGSLAELEQRFRLRAAFPDDPEAPYRLELEPRSHRLARRIQGLALTLDRRRYVPLEIQLTTADGTFTTLTLDAIETQVALPDDFFTLDESVEIVDLGSAGSTEEGLR